MLGSDRSAYLVTLVDGDNLISRRSRAMYVEAIL
ncbi:UNVERIFIED_CONTAM: hypothetical protein DES50_12122 [Williamsia faeni]